MTVTPVLLGGTTAVVAAVALLDRTTASADADADADAGEAGTT